MPLRVGGVQRGGYEPLWFFLKGVSFRRTYQLPSRVSQRFLHGIVSSSLFLFLPSGLEFRNARRAVIMQDASHWDAVPLLYSPLSYTKFSFDLRHSLVFRPNSST